jgi:hypothetical protein
MNFLGEPISESKAMEKIVAKLLENKVISRQEEASKLLGLHR